jgi:hypothetical protein
MTDTVRYLAPLFDALAAAAIRDERLAVAIAERHPLTQKSSRRGTRTLGTAQAWGKALRATAIRP